MELLASEYRIICSEGNPTRLQKTHGLTVSYGGKRRNSSIIKSGRRSSGGIMTAALRTKHKTGRETTSSLLLLRATCTDTMMKSGNDGDEENLKKVWVHFVGVGGSGLSALALLALKQGYEVSGSDIKWSSYMDRLGEAGARLFIGHSPRNLKKGNGLRLPDVVVMSSAIASDNVEILHANSCGVPVYKRDYWLRKITDGYNLIAIAGTHGKSTTASMLAFVLSSMGEDLTAVVGAHVPQFVDGNIIFGRGKTFVLEADEYGGCFLGLSPNIAVVTNVDWEHVDIYQDEEAVKSVFKIFLKQIRDGGHLILCGDSSGAYSLLELNNQASGSSTSYSSDAHQCPAIGSTSYKITSYGFSRYNEWQASAVCANSYGGSDYKLCHKGRKVADISLQIPGNHNVLNSLAQFSDLLLSIKALQAFTYSQSNLVIATVSALNGEERPLYHSINHVQFHLNNFKGVSRRFEMIGIFHGCHVYDDYAHHPSEIHAVLQAARQRFPYKNIVVVFQPHTYSRIAALWKEFASAFSDADEVIVTEIYAARETNVWKLSGRDLANCITNQLSAYVPSLDDVVKKLVLEISKDPNRELVILTLGAGDITTVGRALLKQLQQRAKGYTYSKDHQHSSDG